MARAPQIPPVTAWFEIDRDASGQVVGVRPTQGLYKYLSGENSYSTNVNSGVTEAQTAAANAQATANAAQATATAASQTAQDAPSAGFTVTVDTPTASIVDDALGPLTTNQVTVTPSGGTAPYTYAWTKVSGNTVTINSPSSQATDFTVDPGPNGTKNGQYKCTVTDSAAATASVTVGVSITNILITG